jgi:hypothetical protein
VVKPSPDILDARANEMGERLRRFTVVLGLWLIASSVVWPHSPSQILNACVVGVLVVLVALVALTANPRARYVNSALAVWLFASVFLLPTASRWTAWNDLFVAIMILACSLVPGSMERRLAH